MTRGRTWAVAHVAGAALTRYLLERNWDEAKGGDAVALATTNIEETTSGK